MFKRCHRMNTSLLKITPICLILMPSGDSVILLSFSKLATSCFQVRASPSTSRWTASATSRLPTASKIAAPTRSNWFSPAQNNPPYFAHRITISVVAEPMVSNKDAPAGKALTDCFHAALVIPLIWLVSRLLPLKAMIREVIIDDDP
jgi:hypothetical protein